MVNNKGISNQIVFAIAMLFVVLFLYTGISKLIDFSISVEQLSLTPGLAQFSAVLVTLVSMVEIITAILLFFEGTRLRGLFCSLLLMIAFTGYILYILVEDDTLPCTCGGVIGALSWKQHIWLNIILIALATVGIYFGKSKHLQSQLKKHSI